MRVGGYASKGRTKNVVCSVVNEVVVTHSLRPRATAHPSKTRDDILGDATILRKLPAQLFDHAINVVELGLLAGRSGHAAHAVGHIAAVHSVHEDELLVLRVGEGLLGGGEGLRVGGRRRRRKLRRREGML